MSFAYIKDYRGFYLHWDAWKAFIPHLAQAQNDYQIHYSGRWPFYSHLLLSVAYTCYEPGVTRKKKPATNNNN